MQEIEHTIHYVVLKGRQKMEVNGFTMFSIKNNRRKLARSYNRRRLKHAINVNKIATRSHYHKLTDYAVFVIHV